MVPSSFPCTICVNTNFPNKIKLQKHNASFHKDKKCPQCGKIFVTLSVLKNHLNTHKKAEGPKFSCSFGQCPKKYYSREALNLHQRISHLGTFKRFECNFCNATFGDNRRRQDHIAGVHNGEKAYRCENCPSRFSSLSCLQSHRKFIHSDERPFKCLNCPLRCKTAFLLKKHTAAVHLKKKDFQCHYCPKAFSTRGNLSRHESVIHSQVRRQGLPCYFCKKQFGNRSHMNAHLSTHTNEKPFSCQEHNCKYSSSAVGNLKRHKNLHHPPKGKIIPSKTWSCYFCYKTVGSEFGHLVNHFRMHTNEVPFSCGLCKKSFKNAGSLSNHISCSHTMEKPFKCEECCKSFIKNSRMLHHVRIVHRREKLFFCQLCNYSTYFRQNLASHCARRHNKSNTKQFPL